MLRGTKMKLLKKILLITAVTLAIPVMITGLQRIIVNYQASSIQAKVELKEKSSRTYDPDFLFQVPDGEPVIWTKPEHSATAFIIGGFRAAHFIDWYKELFEKEKVNVIAPVVGLTGWPYRQRNRKWFFHEDMRNHYQVYRAYTANLPANHRIVVISMSFGALSNTIIGIRAKRKPDAHVYLAPLNTRLDYRAASPLMAWLSGKIEYLQHIVPMIIRGKNPKRAGIWDIVNDDLNRKAWNRYGERVVNWEENLAQAVEVRKASRHLETQLLQRLKNSKILIFNGDSDLFFSQEGFKNFARKLNKQNRVEHVTLPTTGHMILNDNGGKKAKKTISAVLHNRYQWKINAH